MLNNVLDDILAWKIIQSIDKFMYVCISTVINMPFESSSIEFYSSKIRIIISGEKLLLVTMLRT